MNRKLKLLVTLFFLIGSAHAQQSESFNFNLSECVKYALENQTAIQNAKLDVEIAKNKVRETTAYGLPQVNASATLQDFIDIPTVLLPGIIAGDTTPGKTFPVQFGTKYNLSYGLEASQLLFDGNYLLGLKASGVYSDLSKKSLERTQIEASAAVTKAYYTALVTKEQSGLLDINIVRLKKLMEDTKALYENGFVEKIDLDRITVLFNNLITEKQKISRLVDLTVYILKFQMGMPVNAQLTLKDKASDIKFDPILINDDTVVYQNRIEYSLMQTQNRLFQLDYKRNLVTYAPSLVAFSSLSRSAQDNDFEQMYRGTQYPTTLIGLKLTVPIIGGGQKYFRTQQAKLALKKSNNDLLNVQNAINLEYQSARTGYSNSIEALETQKKNMELAQEVFRVSKAKYDEGIGSSLEVTIAESSLKEAQNNYISALFGALVAKVDLDKAKGELK